MPTHLPDGLQRIGAMHSGASSFRVTGLQVPVEQLSHALLQAVLQQTPSLQKRDPHSLAAAQISPFILLPGGDAEPHAPAPLHVIPLEHSRSGSVAAAYPLHSPSLPG